MCKNSPLLSVTRIDNQFLIPSGGANPDCLHITLQLTNITCNHLHEHLQIQASGDEIQGR